MGYISRPKISPDYVAKQLVQKNTNRQSQADGPVAPIVEVTMVDDSVRHPVTGKFTRQFQNSQTGGKSLDTPSKDSK